MRKKEWRVVDNEEKRLDNECSVSTESIPEEPPVKRPQNPFDPTLAEKEAHWACWHLPAQPLSLVYIEGRGKQDRGKQDPHYKKVKSNLEHELPTMSMDCADVGNE